MSVLSGASHDIPQKAGGSTCHRSNDKYKLITGFHTDFNNQIRFTPNTIGVNINSLNPSYWHLLHFSVE